jgi:hypothetical protein
MQIACLSLFRVNPKMGALTYRLGSLHWLRNPFHVREEAGTQRYNVGTDTPKLCATSFGGVPLAKSFLAA